MLKIKVPEKELFNEHTGEFFKIKGTDLRLEHSLISVHKWEAKWHKPFLAKKDKTMEEVRDYISCMSLDSNIDPNVFKYMDTEQIEAIISYIQNPMTATWFSDNSVIGAARSSGEEITAEIIYYWMIALNIPVEFEKWHLEQLLTLIKVVNIKNGGKKKLSKQEAAKQRARLNAQRRAKYNTRG